MRVALYYAPALDDPLWSLGARWLGRDPETNAPMTQPDLSGIVEITAEAASYGFHATLKPPMRLREGTSWDDVVTATEDIASTLPPFDLPRLEVADLQGFLALRDAEPSAALQVLSDSCVRGLDHLRASPTEEELARRRKANLSAEHEAMLVRWGYPYVLESWFFHMTLTRRLSLAELAIFRPAAEAMFADTLRAPRRVVDICLFAQPSNGAPFTLAERLPLRGTVSNTL
jgi:putative phosphonate metabolism protein